MTEFWPLVVVYAAVFVCGGGAVLLTFRASERAWRNARLAIAGAGMTYILAGVWAMLLHVQMGLMGPGRFAIDLLISGLGVGALAVVARRWRDERLWVRVGRLMSRIAHPFRVQPQPDPAIGLGRSVESGGPSTLGEALPSDPVERSLPDGRTLRVAPFSDQGDWYARIEGGRPEEIVGWPLASTLASLLGYDVANDEWPAWINKVAQEIVAEARTRGVAAPKDP